MPIVKMICPTVTSAFDIINDIADSGGEVCMIMNGSTPSRCVLSNVDDTSNIVEKHAVGVVTCEPEQWDIDYFNKVMK